LAGARAVSKADPSGGRLEGISVLLRRHDGPR